MQNKKTIMTFSALLILIFHLWINLTHLQIEMFLKHLCVIGVDLFFFVSAYSIAKIDKKEYKSFIRNRFHKIYFKFILFTIIGAFYFHWDIIQFIKIIFGIEFFIKGGGSFLWFLPSIMFLYLLFPLYKLMDLKHPKMTPFVTILLILLTSFLISTFTSTCALLILINRIPIFLLGYYFSKYAIFETLYNNKIKYWFITFASLIIGVIISYFVYFNHFKIVWFKDLNYLLYIPFILGLILLLDKIKVNQLSRLIGSSTLEIYGFQMLFGFKLASFFFKLINNKIISNLVTILILLIISVGVQSLFYSKKEMNFRFISKIKKKLLFLF